MNKTSPLDTLTILGLGRKMDKIKKLANKAIYKAENIEYYDAELLYSGALEDMTDEQMVYDEGHQEGYKQAMIDILDIVDPHRDMFKEILINDKLTK